MRFVEGEAIFKLKALSHFGETQHVLIKSLIYSTSILCALNYARLCHTIGIL